MIQYKSAPKSQSSRFNYIQALGPRPPHPERTGERQVIVGLSPFFLSHQCSWVGRPRGAGGAYGIDQMKILRLNIFPQGMSFPKLNQEQDLDLGEGNQEVQIIRHKFPPKTMRRGLTQIGGRSWASSYRGRANKWESDAIKTWEKYLKISKRKKL